LGRRKEAGGWKREVIEVEEWFEVFLLEF